jgi:hypothetical protein
MKERTPPISFRLQPDIRLWLTEKAKTGDRSLNAEVNRVLRQVKELEDKKETAVNN